MQIDRILMPITTLGPGNRLGIWTIGCPHHCYKCSNPELWEPDNNKDISLSDLLPILKENRSSVNGITITGGDPFFQHSELYELLKILKSLEYDDILVYTGYKYEFLNDKFPQILKLIDVLVDGLYVDSLNNNRGQKGSSNQRCIILQERLKDKYIDFDVKKRERQNFIYNGKIISIGIPTSTS